MTRHISPGSQNLSIKSSPDPRNLKPVRLVTTAPTPTLLKMFILEAHSGQMMYDRPTGTLESASLDDVRHVEHFTCTLYHPVQDNIRAGMAQLFFPDLTLIGLQTGRFLGNLWEVPIAAGLPGIHSFERNCGLRDAAWSFAAGTMCARLLRLISMRSQRSEARGKLLSVKKFPPSNLFESELVLELDQLVVLVT